ncbi:hypothetical protein DFP73DRAFT_100802 [Morchella snyderi]|nr:hypothetical protein DFP73DRAFT_100802 [Morchella snyderi]
MTTISTESNIDRAKKAIRSKFQHVMESRQQQKTIAMEKPKPSNRQDSPQRKVFEAFFNGRARRTLCFVRSKQQGKSSGVRDEAVKIPTLGNRFFSLPVELQLGIVNMLFFFDLLNLRQTSKKFRNLTIQHESHIVRHHINMWVPKHIIELYPPPANNTPTLSYLTDLAYKQRVSTQLAQVLANQIVKEMMGGRHQRAMTKDANNFVISQLRTGTSPLIFALFHFLETYRERKLEHLLEGDLNAAERSSTILSHLSHEKNMALQSEILKIYPDDRLLQVHQMYHLLLHMLIRRLSPARMPFGLRTISRWSSQRPTNEAFAKVLVLGGIREVWELYRIKGYSNRRKALEKYLKKLDSDKMQHSTPLNDHAESSSATGASKSVPRSFPGRGPSLDIPSKVARLDVDELMDVWTPAAEERLLSREIVTSLDEVGCCGLFVAQLLGSNVETDNEEDGEDSEDEDDSGDDTPGPGAADGIHYTGGSTSAQDNGWDGGDLHEEQEHDDDDDDGSFADDEGAEGSSSV